MAELGLSQVMFELCPICIIVSGVPVDESIEQDRIKGQSPIWWRRIERMILPFSPVVYGSISCLISINIVCDLRRIITKRAGSCNKQQEDP